MLRELRVLRVPPELVEQLVVCLVELPAKMPYLTRYPVLSPHEIHYSAADLDVRVGLEFHTAIKVERIYRGYQRYNALVDDVVR